MKRSVEVELLKTRWGWMFVPITDLYVGRALLEYGEYSPVEVAAITRFIHSDDVVVDVGANLGGITLPMAHKVGMDGKVIAFEPQPAVEMLLKASVAVNEMSQVKVCRQAVGTELGKTVMIPAYTLGDEGNYGGVGFQQWGEGVPTMMTTLNSLKLEKCNFVKIDVEGMELDVLKGGNNLIAMHKPILFIENDRPENSKALVEYLQDVLHYRCYWMITPLFSPDNYHGKQENIYADANGVPTCSFNMLCVPAESGYEFTGLREVSPDDNVGSCPANWIVTGIK